jgi:preprotein translocase subunit SecY
MILSLHHHHISSSYINHTSNNTHILYVGGAVAGLIFVLSDLLGALGGGTGVMLAVSTISECAEYVSTDPQFSFLS